LQAALMLHQMSPDTPLILFTIFNDAIMDRLARNVGVAVVISKTDQLTRLADEVQRLTTPTN
jgi:hypothetical protein